MAVSKILIAVIGVTGAGKTTFVNTATGENSLAANDGVDSVTEEAVSVTCTIDGQSVTLIDTPGFDDRKRTEVDILKLVAKHLMNTYLEGTKLNGIIFLQPINQPRVGAAEAGRTRLFKKLLGEQAFRRVVIGGTMWTDRADAEKKMEQRAQHKDIWEDMVKGGAKTIVYDNTPEGAAEIIRILMKNKPGDLLIQKELASGKGLEETAAGREIEKQKGEDIAKLMAELRDVKQDREATSAQILELQDKIHQREAESAAGREIAEKKAEDIAKLTAQLEGLEKDRAEAAKEMRQLKDTIHQREDEIMDLKRAC
ncbi:P-loop containing nucleoside triphosphate hydrolase protein [Chaetomium sp. MPI-SDFR-AT-0129]|nr:P-loop containing nucleoside triphosphate hydrolase protein [Chaetomium sp. MPI-SDFR-AT-0129]